MIRKLTDALRDPDRALLASMEAAIELAKRRYALDAGAQWQPGEPLKLLLAGYVGTRNTGADVRVEEMIRQFRHIFGDENLSLSVLTLDPSRSKGYFRGARQIELPSAFPPFLFKQVHAHHGVVACEGSMFKSKFANALSTMMAGAIGLASTEGKLAVGYGGEAGAMDPPLERFVRRHCGDAYVIARNEASIDVLAKLGVKAELGTDTAWTFTPCPDELAKERLLQQGWDGKKPIVCICPINAYWWPVRPSIGKGLSVAMSGRKDPSHYKSFYFHADSPEIRDAQARYLGAMGDAATKFLAEYDAFPIVVGMEALDRSACEILAARLQAPAFVSDEYDMYELVGIVRQARLLVSSRYHAIVTSMPAGTPSIGVTMDERITNLMADREQPELALRCDDQELGNQLTKAMNQVWSDLDHTRERIETCVAHNLVRMGGMGRSLLRHVQAHHPQIPSRVDATSENPLDFLPPLPARLQQLVTRPSTHPRSDATQESQPRS